MKQDLTLFEPRPEDDRAESPQDDESTYCSACEKQIEDDDFEAVQVCSKWMHLNCKEAA